MALMVFLMRLGDLFDNPMPSPTHCEAVVLFPAFTHKLLWDKVTVAVSEPFFALCANLFYPLDHKNVLHLIRKKELATQTYDMVQIYNLNSALDIAYLTNQIKSIIKFCEVKKPCNSVL